MNATNVYATGNIAGNNLYSTRNVWAGANVTAASNVNATNVYATGNIAGNNLYSTYNVWAGANITTASNVNATNVLATGNISANNLYSTYNVWAGSNVNAVNIYASQNIYSSNIATGGFQSNTTNTVMTSTLNLAGGLLISGTVAGTNQTIITTGAGASIQWGSLPAGSQWTTTGSDIYYTTGKVGVGTATPGYPLHVSGTAQSKAAPYSNLAYQSGGWYQAYQATTATSLKIYTDGNIGCNEVDVFSDRRIKAEIKDTNSETNLNIIKSLNVRDFAYIDKIEHGACQYTGLIAQEVKEILGPAVSVHRGVIPNIFQVPDKVNGRSCQFKNKIEGVDAGTKVKVFDGEEEKTLEVICVSEFEIEFNEPLSGPQVFVYGQAVPDLHTVSYDRIVPVLISAVQELIKKIETR